MTKKHYEAIAAAIKAVRDSYQPHWNENLFRAVRDTAHALAATFAAQNPKFQAHRFLKSCGF